MSKPFGKKDCEFVLKKIIKAAHQSTFPIRILDYYIYKC